MKKYSEWIFVGAVLALLLVYSAPTLTTKPRVSYDEGFFAEEAYNFEQYGKLDIVIAPNTFSLLPHIASSSGFPGTVPLALFYKIFGFGLVQTRIYALLWMCAFFVVAYLFTRKFFGIISAIFTLLFLISFPPLHENGRMAMGDIPGFTYLLLGFLFLPKKSITSGILLGLAAISRPSVYGAGFIAACVERIATLGMKSVSTIFFLILGVIPSVIVSIVLYLPESMRKIFWQDTILFLRAPTFGINSSPAQNFSNNLHSIFTTQTLFYFLILTLAIIGAFFIKGRRVWSRSLVIWSSVYSLFVIAYFMRSPGWFKYLLPFQLLVFFFLPSSIEILAEWIVGRLSFIRTFVSPKAVARSVLTLLILVQCIQLLFFADIFKSNDVEQTMNYLSNTVGTSSTVAFIHGSFVPLSVPIGQRYNFNVVNEKLFLGQNPMSLSPLPTYVVKPEGIETFSAQFQGEYAKTLETNYVLEKQIGRLDIYKLTSASASK